VSLEGKRKSTSLLLSGCPKEENAPSLGKKATAVLSFLFCSTPGLRFFFVVVVVFIEEEEEEKVASKR